LYACLLPTDEIVAAAMSFRKRRTVTQSDDDDSFTNNNNSDMDCSGRNSDDDCSSVADGTNGVPQGKCWFSFVHAFIDYLCIW
jgi:hypothetical protein